MLVNSLSSVFGAGLARVRGGMLFAATFRPLLPASTFNATEHFTSAMQLRERAEPSCMDTTMPKR